MKRISLISGLLLLLGACGSEGHSIQEPTFEELKEHAHIVKSASESNVFVDFTSYGYTDDAKLRSFSGTEIESKDIRVGSLIDYEDTGVIAESYPSQGTIKSLTLYDDERSKRFEKGIAHLLSNQDTNAFIGYKLLNFDGDELIIEFTDYLDADVVYNASINLETLEFEVAEASGE
ncbi:hypothetical protein ACFPYN_17005 [Paenisporosarcina macmurdoensis]|uniref:Lipoprotein n=1 Tax=Paenisporosarcina macmurdoensis TaxID=212659 RepID=A0ABW1LB01_9BACL